MMKKLLFFLAATAATAGIHSQTAYPYANNLLDINSVRAGVNSNGDLFTNYSTNQFEVPAGGNAQTMYASTLWIGGLDTGASLHMAAQTYRQSGDDFFSGPVMNSASYSSANDLLWATTWKINKTTIDTFLMWHANPAQFPNYTIPWVIQNWPGNGDISQGQAAQLAPYFDYNGNGIYEPSNGDYPCIKGDQAIFVIFNDDRAAHAESGGQKFGIEVHMMVYAYKSPGTWLDSAVFVNYRLFNRTNNNYDSLYIGSWTDLDIGYYGDDYIGCDVMRDMYFGYNGDANDGSSSTASFGTYGANPPAEGVLFLRGPEPAINDGVDNDHDGQIDEPNEFCAFNRFVYYENNFTVTGNPTVPLDYYHYMSGEWKDGSHVTYGGNGYGGMLDAAYMFPGASDPLGVGTNYNPQAPWDENTVANTPGDRRGLGVSGPFPLPGLKDMCMDFVYLYGRDASATGPYPGLARLRQIADSAKTFYPTTQPCTCVANPLGVNENSSTMISLYPNPAKDNITIEWQPQNAGARLELYDVNGKIVSAQLINRSTMTIDLSGMAQGIYMVRIIDGNRIGSAKVIKQ